MSDGNPAPRSRAEVDEELALVSEELRRVDTTIEGSYRWPSLTAGVLLVLVALVLVIAAAVAFQWEGDDAPPPVLLVVIAAALIWPAFLLLRRGYAPYWDAARYRKDLIQRVRRLQEILAGQAVDDQGRPVELDGIPVPLDRRATVYAQTLWNRMPWLGPSPAVMLERLPEGTAKARLAFHRYIGWGMVAGLILVGASVGLLIVRWS